MLRPEHPDVNHTFGLALLRTGRAAEADVALREALHIAPENPAYLRSLAEAAALQNRKGEARDLLVQARYVGLDPASAAALEALIAD